MGKGFELKTRRQFAGIIDQRDRWKQRQNSAGAVPVFDRLTGDTWARNNCALEESGQTSKPEPEAWQAANQLQMECHLNACRWFLERARRETAPAPADLRQLHSRLHRSASQSTIQLPASAGRTPAGGARSPDWELFRTWSRTPWSGARRTVSARCTRWSKPPWCF